MAYDYVTILQLDNSLNVPPRLTAAYQPWAGIHWHQLCVNPHGGEVVNIWERDPREEEDSPNRWIHALGLEHGFEGELYGVIYLAGGVGGSDTLLRPGAVIMNRVMRFIHHRANR